jgi:GT2 family glycosyltransferase
MKAGPSLRAVVAIPARNEERRLSACLAALAQQIDLQGELLSQKTFGVLLLLNNCSDRSLAVGQTFVETFDDSLRIVDRHLPAAQSHAGGARRLAMDLAADWLQSEGVADGVLLTTDADSRVGSTWIAQNLAAITEGVDAVAGDIVLDPDDESRLPDALRQRGFLESTYERQLIEIAAYLDPLDHDPWPHHATASGASLAISLSAYRRIGGLPALPLGEDKALVQALHRHDSRIRFAPEIKVVTSGRLIGRAEGGVATTMRRRIENPSALCDAYLEPLEMAFMRSFWRGQIRAVHRLKKESGGRDVFSFGEVWESFEPLTAPRNAPIRPSDLLKNIERAHHTLEHLRARLGAPGDVEAKALKLFAPNVLKNTLCILQ